MFGPNKQYKKRTTRVPWNLVGQPSLLRWLKIKGNKVLTGPRGASPHVSAGLVWSLSRLRVTWLFVL
jgi:hypothetical protein